MGRGKILETWGHVGKMVGEIVHDAGEAQQPIEIGREGTWTIIWKRTTFLKSDEGRYAKLLGIK